MDVRASAVFVDPGEGGSEMLSKWRQKLRDRRRRRHAARQRAARRRRGTGEDSASAPPQRLAMLMAMGRQVIFLPSEDEEREPTDPGRKVVTDS